MFGEKMRGPRKRSSLKGEGDHTLLSLCRCFKAKKKKKFRDNLYTATLASIISPVRTWLPPPCPLHFLFSGEVKNSKGGGGGEREGKTVPEKWSKMQEYLQGALKGANLAGLLL